MSVEFYRGSPGKFDSRTLSRETLSRWTGRILPPSDVDWWLCLVVVTGSEAKYLVHRMG